MTLYKDPRDYKFATDAYHDEMVETFQLTLRDLITEGKTENELIGWYLDYFNTIEDNHNLLMDDMYQVCDEIFSEFNIGDDCE